LVRVALLEQAIAEAGPISREINNWEKAWPLAEIDHRAGEGLSPKLRADIAAGRAMSPEEYRVLLHRRDDMRASLVGLADEVDVCITLSAPGPAPLGLESTGNAIFNQAASTLRTPAVSLPLLQVRGMPVGVQLIGYPLQERPLSGFAEFLSGVDGDGKSLLVALS
jgi:Asp-tRNA(Asn)/Glu-tRNA(Gln) amidotransferase A subunit family amidase